MRTIALVVSIGICCLCTSFRKKQKLPSLSSAKEISKNLCKVTDSLYAWQTETSNYEYNLFVKAMQQELPTSWQQYAVDSTGWRNEFSYCEPFVVHYHRHPSFNYYPVVNVSYANAVAYCNWLTVKYNADEKRKFRKVLFTLPTKQEWILAASGGDTAKMYPWGNGFIKNKKGMDLCNYKKETIDERSAGKMFSTAEVKSFFPNNFGLYNCSGNVAEMLLTPNVASGGSWNTAACNCQIRNVVNYTTSSSEIGFRVFMKIIAP